MRRAAPLVTVTLIGLVFACGSDDESRSSSPPTGESSVDSVPTEPPVATVGTSTDISVGSTAATISTEAQPFAGKLTFDWPLGCTVPVEENVTKRGQSALLTYGLRSEETDAGIEISFDEITIDEFNGAEVPDQLAQQVMGQFVLPDFLVGADGVEIGVVGIEETLAQMDKAGLIDADEFTPQAIALLEETVLTKYWGSWVGFWAGIGSIDEPRAASDLPLAVGDSEMTIDLVVESLPTAVPGAATLRAVQTLAGDDFLRAIAAGAATLGGEQSPNSLPAADGRRISTVEVTTDPATLQPASVSFVDDVELTMDGVTQTDVETREWRFDWANASCN